MRYYCSPKPRRAICTRPTTSSAVCLVVGALPFTARRMSPLISCQFRVLVGIAVELHIRYAVGARVTQHLKQSLRQVRVPLEHPFLRYSANCAVLGPGEEAISSPPAHNAWQMLSSRCAVEMSSIRVRLCPALARS